MSTDSTYVGKNAKNLTVSPTFQPFAGVYVHTNDEVDDEGYIAGDISGNTGRVLEIYNPWATQETADNIFASIGGWMYQPYEAGGAEVDPAAEIGDGVTINDVYSGIYTRSTTFGRLMASDLIAPQSEELSHEYGYESKSNRQYNRKMASISATLLLNAEQIDARVTKTSPEGQTSFGWNLTDSEWTIYNGNKTILRASASGLAVYGQIEAESGHIGGNNGFVITANAIYKNLSRFGGTQTSGVYIGTDGIQLGQNFKVDSSGALTASSGTFTGTVYAGSIQYGGQAGTFSGQGLTGGTVTGGSGGSLASGTVAYGNVGFTGTLDQTWTNAANIESIFAKFASAGVLSVLGQFQYKGRVVGLYPTSSGMPPVVLGTTW